MFDRQKCGAGVLARQMPKTAWKLAKLQGERYPFAGVAECDARTFPKFRLASCSMLHEVVVSAFGKPLPGASDARVGRQHLAPTPYVSESD
jgi:hypothetical protein